MHYVLFTFFYILPVVQPPTVTTAEFSSREACYTAAQKVVSRPTANPIQEYVPGIENLKAQTVCIPKGK